MNNSTPPPRLVPDRPSDAAWKQAFSEISRIPLSEIEGDLFAAIETRAREIDVATSPSEAPGESAEDRFEQYVATLIAKNPDVQKLGERLADWLDEDRFNNIEPILTGIAQQLAAAPAAPAAVHEFVMCRCYDDTAKRLCADRDRCLRAVAQSEAAPRVTGGREVEND